MSDKSITIIGLWHQGIVAAACLAEAGFSVTGADADVKVVEGLNRGESPIYEPGLEELLSAGLASGKLKFRSDIKTAVKHAPFVFLMFDTPVDEDDRLSTQTLFQTIQDTAAFLEDGVTIWVTSQVPVGTCGRIREKIAALRPGLDFGIAYSPENLRLGQALEAFRKPALPVIGADENQTHERMEEILQVFGVLFRRVNLNTAEMTKHALNAFLAACVTFGGELGNLCDALGADGIEVAKSLRLEPRVGSKAMILPGLGFSGGTLARDIQVLRGFGDYHGIETHFLDGVWAANQYQNDLVVRRLEKWFPSLKNLRVAVWGLTYKPGTSTLRRSAALDLIRQLTLKGAAVRTHDPKADRDEIRKFTNFAFFENPYDAVNEADVLVVMTGWEDYSTLDFTEVKKRMKHPLLLDTNNMFDRIKLMEAGIRLCGIGRGQEEEKKERP